MPIPTTCSNNGIQNIPCNNYPNSLIGNALLPSVLNYYDPFYMAIEDQTTANPSNNLLFVCGYQSASNSSDTCTYYTNSNIPCYGMLTFTSTSTTSSTSSATFLDVDVYPETSQLSLNNIPIIFYFVPSNPSNLSSPVYVGDDVYLAFNYGQRVFSITKLNIGDSPLGIVPMFNSMVAELTITTGSYTGFEAPTNNPIPIDYTQNISLRYGDSTNYSSFITCQTSWNGAPIFIEQNLNDVGPPNTIRLFPAVDPSIMQTLCCIKGINSGNGYNSPVIDSICTLYGSNSNVKNLYSPTTKSCEVAVGNYCGSVNQADVNCGCNLPSPYYKDFAGLPPECYYIPCAQTELSYKVGSPANCSVNYCQITVDGINNPNLEQNVRVSVSQTCGGGGGGNGGGGNNNGGNSKTPKINNLIEKIIIVTLAIVFALILIALFVKIISASTKKSDDDNDEDNNGDNDNDDNDDNNNDDNGDNNDDDNNGDNNDDNNDDDNGDNDDS